MTDTNNIAREAAALARKASHLTKPIEQNLRGKIAEADALLADMADPTVPSFVDWLIIAALLVLCLLTL